MASIGDIKVRLSLDTASLEKSLRSAEYKLKRFSRVTGEIGNSLLKSVTLPIAGLGIAAIKTAGDFEQLTNGLTSIMGDAATAKAEIELLRKAALAPGLDLTQAVKGSVRLQSVGISAELARKALSNFGNAIALAGGTSSDLDGVTLALTQIVSKGKISAEEINQLAERVPQVRKAIESAFGTGDSEALQKLGISAEEFVTKVTDEMGKLPQAVGGINNSINNAGQAVTQFLVTLGNDIEKSFNISDKVAQFADYLNDLADRFSRLEDGTKAMILKTLAFAAAVGPVIKVVSIFSETISAGVSMSRLFIKNMAGLGNSIIAAGQKFAAMDKIMKVTTIGLVIAGITAATLAYQAWSKQISEAEKVHRTLNSVEVEAAKNIVAEKIQIDKLKATINDENVSREDKIKALKEQERLTPGILEGLSLERDSIDKINTSLDGYIERIEKRARLAAANEKLIEIEKQLLDKAQMIEDAKPWYADMMAGGSMMGMATGMDISKTVNKNIESLEAQKAALIDYINTAEKGAGAGGGAIAGGGSGGGTFKRKGQEKVKARAPEGGVEGLERIAVNFEAITLKSAEAGVALDNFAARGGVLDPMITQAEIVAEKMENIRLSINQIIESGLQNMIIDTAGAMGEAIVSANSFGGALSAIGSTILNSLSSMLGQVGQLAITTGIAVAGIKKALQSLNPAVAIAAGVALIALSKAVPKLLAKKVQGFADGVENFGGGMALVGERGPELVNLPKGSDVLNHKNSMAAMNGGGTQKIEVYGEIRGKGDDLYVVVRKAEARRARLGR